MGLFQEFVSNSAADPIAQSFASDALANGSRASDTNNRHQTASTTVACTHPTDNWLGCLEMLGQLALVKAEAAVVSCKVRSSC